MGKIFAAILVFLLLAPALVFAQAAEATAETDANADVSVRAKIPFIRPIKHIFLHGAGISINSSDANDVLHAKMIVSAVNVVDRECLRAEEERARVDCIIRKTIGLLSLDENNYRLREILVGEDSVSASIYLSEKDANGTIGAISVKRIEKPSADIWAGTIVFTSGIQYNVYLLGVKREFSAAEAKESMGDYCKKHPRERACRHLNLCKNHPDNPNCNEIKEKLCTGNAGDIRCRSFLKKHCTEKPEGVFCKKITVSGKTVITINPRKVKIHETEETSTDEEKESSGADTEAETTVGVEVGRKRVNVKVGNVIDITVGG